MSSVPIGDDWSLYETFGNPALVTMLGAAKSFTHDLTTPLSRPRWLSLLGSCGAGKTMLASMILDHGRAFCERYPYLEGAQRIRRIRSAEWPDLAEQLRRGKYCALDEYKTAWLTLIDDIGAEYDARTTFVASKLYELVNARVGRWTIVTANLGMESIASRMDVRIASRMVRGGSDVIEVDVPDFNLR